MTASERWTPPAGGSKIPLTNRRSILFVHRRPAGAAVESLSGWMPMSEVPALVDVVSVMEARQSAIEAEQRRLDRRIDEKLEAARRLVAELTEVLRADRSGPAPS